MVLPIFDAVGLKVTFFLTTNWVTDWPGFAAAAANGHEVTVHTVSHPDLSTLPVEQQRDRHNGDGEQHQRQHRADDMPHRKERPALRGGKHDIEEAVESGKGRA